MWGFILVSGGGEGERGGVGVHFGEWRRGEERGGGSILVSGGEERREGVWGPFW